MSKFEEIIRFKIQHGLSIRQISMALNLKKSTVSDYLRRYRASGLTPEDIPKMSDREIIAALFPERKVSGCRDSIRPPDFAQMYTELKYRHITRQLLWEEYRSVNPNGYGYSQYCQLNNRTIKW